MPGPTRSGTIQSGKGRSFGTSRVDVDSLIDWAERASGEFRWTTWVPDPSDEIIVSTIKPPLTFSIVLQTASLHAWADGQELTQEYIDTVRSGLASKWYTATINKTYVAVADCLSDLFLWSAIVKMPERDREAVRADLVRRKRGGSTPVTTTPPVSDPKKDWAIEHGSGYTKIMQDLLKPIPPFKLGS